MTRADGTRTGGTRLGEDLADDLDVVVAQSITVAKDIKALTLQSADGAPLPAWQPGAHVDVILPSGAVRQYSLCGDPEDNHSWRIAVLREAIGRGRGGSEYIHTDVHTGNELRVGLPRNNFELVDAPAFVFVAGGIGITPILPMIADAQRRGVPWRLVYGGRSAETMAFRDELEVYGPKVAIYTDDGDGPIDLERELTGLADGTAVYCCGPAGLLEAIERLHEDGVIASLHTERFAGGNASSADDHEFEVVLARQGKSFTIKPGESILGTLESNGIDALSSCHQGMCGRCEVDVLDGIPDHRDSILTLEERATNEFMLICVSRCVGDRLVIDL
ncbi:PDR/VanB family oxidoreductase [Gordonia amicalis]